MGRVIVAPSILAADFSRLGDEIYRVEAAGADWIHCDIMDGHFVDNISFGPEIVGRVRGLTSLPLDIHLMIEHADHYVPRFIKAGANSITVHVEPEAKHSGTPSSGISVGVMEYWSGGVLPGRLAITLLLLYSITLWEE